MPGLHPMLVRFAGLPRHTVPALEIDGELVQRSREITRRLERLRPDPPLFPPTRTASVPLPPAHQPPGARLGGH